MTEKNVVQTIHDTLWDAMKDDDRVLILGEDVVPVHDDAFEAVGRPPLGDVLDGHLLRQRHADRVHVVLAVPHHRQPVDPREVEPLVPIAFAGRPVAEPAADDRILAPIRDRVGDPGGVGDLGGDG